MYRIQQTIRSNKSNALFQSTIKIRCKHDVLTWFTRANRVKEKTSVTTVNNGQLINSRSDMALRPKLPKGWPTSKNWPWPRPRL